MSERVCKDCDGLVELVLERDAEGDLDLMCVLCGAALTLGGMLLGELAALEDDRLSA